jgi:hypothetical protein
VSSAVSVTEMSRKRYDPERDALYIHRLFHGALPMNLKAENAACEFCRKEVTFGEFDCVVAEP